MPLREPLLAVLALAGCGEPINAEVSLAWTPAGAGAPCAEDLRVDGVVTLDQAPQEGEWALVLLLIDETHKEVQVLHVAWLDAETTALDAQLALSAADQALYAVDASDVRVSLDVWQGVPEADFAALQARVGTFLSISSFAEDYSLWLATSAARASVAARVTCLD